MSSMSSNRNSLRTIKGGTFSSKRGSELPRKIMRSLLAAGVTLAPVWGQSALAAAPTGNIVRTGTSNNLLVNNKAEIFAERANGGVGLNRFETFSLGNNQIANLYFKTATGINALNTLVNTVNSKIDIYGTVNAVRNNKIGGNLYFLSPQGMVVGAGGVINAGSLTVMTPTTAFLSEITTQTQPDAVLTQIKDNYVQNDNASIDIHGTLNATTGIDLRAAYIDVTKKTGAAVAPLLRTGTLFDTTVNTDGLLTSVAVKNEKLTATVNDAGKIVLTDSSNLAAATAADKVIGDGSINIKASATTNNTSSNFLGLGVQDTVETKVQIGEGSSINAAGNVEISATSKMQTVNDILNFWDLLAFTKAEVGINGSVTGGDLKIYTDATSSYSDKNYNNLLAIFDQLLSRSGYNFGDKLTGLVWGKMQEKGLIANKADMVTNFVNQFYIPFGVVRAQATTNIGELADLKALQLRGSNGNVLSYVKDGSTILLGGNMEIKAKSSATNSIAVNIQRQYAKDSQERPNVATGGFVYENSSGKALVNMNGKAEAEQDLTIAADAANTNKIKLTVKKPKLHPNTQPPSGKSTGTGYVMAAVGVVVQENEAEINLGTESLSDKGTVAAPKIKAGGAVRVSAKSVDTVASQVEVETNDETAVSTAVNVVSSTGHASLNNFVTVAGKSVTLETGQELKKLSTKTDNEVNGENTGIDWLLDTDVVRGQAQTMGEYMNLLQRQHQNAAGNNVQQAPGGGQGGKGTSWNDYFGIGASLLIANTTNTAITNIEPTAKIIATNGNLMIGAKTVIGDTSLITRNGFVNTNETTKVGVSAAVAVENVNDTAEINIKSKDAEKAELRATGGKVDVTATTKNDYNRLAAMTKAVVDGLEATKEHWTDWERQGLKDKLDRVKSVIADIVILSKKDKEESVKKSKLFVSKAKAAIDIVTELTGTTDLYNALMAFTDAANYTNMYVSAFTKSNTQNKTDVTAMAAGTVGVQNLHNTANVNLYEETSIVANAEKQALIKATVSEGNVLGAGKWAAIPDFNTSGGAKNGLGGTVGVQNSHNNANVTVNKGVTIDAGYVDIGTDSYVMNVGAALGGAKTSERGLTGMVSYIGGEATANTQVDDDVNFTARKKVDKVTKTDKDGNVTSVDEDVSTGAVSVTSKNKTILTNVVGDLAASDVSSVGVSVGVINFDTRSVAELHNIEKDANGNFVDTEGKGIISANSVNVDALTDGILNNLTVAGVSTGRSQNANNAAGGVNVAAGGAAAGGIQNAQINAGNGGKQDPMLQVGAAGSVAWNDVDNETKATLDNVAITLTRPEITSAVTDPKKKSDITTSVNVQAKDASYIGAYSGAMALSKVGNNNNSNFKASLSGAVAGNDIVKNTMAALGNNEINVVDVVTNKAENSGAQVAAGLSLGVETGRRNNGLSINLGASGSANYVDSTVLANMHDNTLQGGKMGVNNIAYDKDVQVGGGVTAQYANATATVGAAVSINKVTNDIQATMSNNNIGLVTARATDVHNLAVSKLTQVGTAVSVGISTGDNKSYAVGDVAVTNNVVTNTVAASLTNGTIYADKITSEARDGKLSSTETSNQYLAKLNTVANQVTMADDGAYTDKDGNSYTLFDLDGSEAREIANGANGNDIDVSTNADGSINADARYTATNFAAENGGNTIVGVALGFGLKQGQQTPSGAAAVAVDVNKVTNSFSAEIKGATLTTKNNGTDAGVVVTAKTDTAIVGVAAGVAVGITGDKMSIDAAGSGVKNDLTNNAIAKVENSTINTNKLQVKGTNTSTLVAVAGQLSAQFGSKGMAAGLTWADNHLNNTTAAYARGITLAGVGSGGTALAVEADNTGKTWAVGVAAGVSIGYGAVEGAVAKTTGKNNTEAIVDSYINSNPTRNNIITNASAVTVKATDNTTEKTVAGSVSLAAGQNSYAAVGGAVAYSEIGKSKDDKQLVKAELSNATITSTNGSVAVEAQNNAKLLNLALGGAVRVNTGNKPGVSLEGSGASSYVYTDTKAEMHSVTVTPVGEVTPDATVRVAANSDTDITNSADALSVSAGSGVNLAGGAAVSIVKSDADTTTSADHVTGNVKKYAAEAISTNKILNVSVGLGVGAGSDVAGTLTGNVAVNNIANDTTVTVAASTITARKLVEVLAASQEEIRNFGGALSVSASAEAAVAFGVTFVSNTITGNTKSTATDSTLAAVGINGDAEGIDTNDYTVADDGKVTAAVSKKAGVVVVAESEHKLFDISITGGVAASGTVSGAADVSVAMNNIGGSTTAEVLKTDINKNATTAGDVTVAAHDKTDLSSHVGSLSVGASGTLGIGLAGAASTNAISRDTTAMIVGKTGTEAERSTLNANVAKVYALGETLVHLSETGVAAGASAAAGAAVTASVSLEEFIGRNTALVQNVNGKVHGLIIDAERAANVRTYNNAISVSGGIGSGSIGVGVTEIEDNSQTNAELSKATITKAGGDDSKVEVLANNNTHLETELSSDNLAISIGGSLGIAVENINMQAQVGVNVDDAEIGTADKRFSDFNAKANNKLYNKFQNIDVAAGSLLGIAIGKGSLNINTGTASELNNVTVHARNSLISAKEQRATREELAGAAVGAVGVGVNVMFTNVGTDLKDNYQYDKDGDGKSVGSYSSTGMQSMVNEALRKNKTIVEGLQAKEYTRDAGIRTPQTSSINKGVAAGGIKTAISNATLMVTDKLEVQAKNTTDTDIRVAQGEIAAVAVAVSSSHVDVAEKQEIKIDKSVLRGKNVAIASETGGTLKNYVGQGSFTAGLYSDTTGYITHCGTNNVIIDGSTVTASAEPQNTSFLDINAINKVKIDNSALTVNVGGVAGGRLILEGTDSTVVNVLLGKEATQNNSLAGDTVSIMAKNEPVVKDEILADVHVSAVTGEGSVVASRADGSASLTVTDKNTIDGNLIKLYSLTGTYPQNTGTTPAEKEYTTEAVNHAVAVSGVSVIVNKARTYNEMQATTNVGPALFKNEQFGLANIEIGAQNASTSNAYVHTVNVGLGIGSGSTFAQTHVDNKVATTVAGGTRGIGGQNVTISASNSDTITSKAVGAYAGVLDISPFAAQVENTVTSQTELSVTGKIEAADKLTLHAARTDTADLYADGLSVAVAGGGDTHTTSDITANTRVNTDSATLISGGDMLLDAENTIKLNRATGDEEHDAAFAKMSAGTGVGLIEINTAGVDNTVKANADVILKASKLTSQGAMDILSHSGEAMTVNSYIYSLGALGVGVNKVTNDITNTDRVELINSELKTGKAGRDLTLSTADDLKLYSYSYAENPANIIGATDAKVINKLKRNNYITISGDKNVLYSMQDINLYAGKHGNGTVALFDLDTEAADFNGSVIPIALTPTVTNEIAQNNQILLDAGSKSSSVRHTNLYASQGREMARVYAGKYVGIWSNNREGSFVTTDNGETIGGKTATNTVTIKGSVVAGVANRIDFTIGEAGNIVILDPVLRATVNGAEDKDKILINVTAHESTNLTKSSVTFGTEDYTNTLYARYKELNNLMLEYAQDGITSAVYLGYKAEADRIKQEMLTLGLAEVNEDNKVVPKATLNVDYVEIPELASSGGNIVVDTDNFAGFGTGIIKAQGTPEVNITNNTNLMLKVNAITVDAAGGKLIYKDSNISGSDTATFNSKINQKNKSTVAGFATVEAADGQAGEINIRGNYNGNAINYRGSFEDPDGTRHDVNGTIKPMANILVQGNVFSREGIVDIRSRADSIVIQGKTVKDAVAISGATINLSADQGSITQGYTDGIVNIGADVRSQYDSEYQRAIGSGNHNHTVDISQISTTIADGSKATGSYIAGGAVYINAADINVNGVIQSGFGDYYADISDANTQAAIARIKYGYVGGREVSDAVVTGSDTYKIIDGGAIWDSTAQCYKYRLNVYYNPSTNKILVQDVNANGGKVFLTGRVSSTGSGKIVCLNGVSGITIANATDYDLQLGTLTTNDVSGLVSITDTAKNKLTEITGTHVVEKTIGSQNPDTTSAYNPGYVYQPSSGLRYTWTTGNKTATYRRYVKKITDGGWGLWENGATETDLATWTDTTPPASSQPDEKTNRRDGQTIRTGGSGGSSVTIHTRQENAPVITKEGERRWETGLWGYHKHYEVTWTVGTKSINTYDASIKADYPINVSFVGHQADDATINVNTTQNLKLTGDIGNTKVYETLAEGVVTGRNEKGTIRLIAQTGAIEQTGGSLYGANINLAAAKDMKNISVTAGDVVNLSAMLLAAPTASDYEQNTVSVNVKGAYLAKGDVVLGSMGALQADSDIDTGTGGVVAVTTTGSSGNITQRTGTIIAADRIDLISTNGAIYGQKDVDNNTTALRLYAGQQPMGTDTLDASVNAIAKGDIKLEQFDGNMRVGRIYSQDGDVDLTVAGSIEDALPYVSSDRGNADDMLKRWRDVGIIDGNDDMQADKDNLHSDAGLADYETWDANALLYAIQDSVVNQTSANLPQTSSKDPNVIGHNITITAGDGVGLNSGEQTRINVQTLLDKDTDGNYLHLDDLKTLSKADASTVTWDKVGDVTYAVITETLPIGIQQTTKTVDGNVVGGKLTVRSLAAAGSDLDGDIFVQGREEADPELANRIVKANLTKNLQVGQLLTSVGMARLSSLGSVYNGAPAGATAITAKSLYITAADGSLGTLITPLTINLFGHDVTTDGLSAVAKGGVYFDQFGDNDLLLRNISSGEGIYLAAEKSLIMGNVTGTAAVSYLRAENNGDITLESRTGSIGAPRLDEDGATLHDQNKGVRILNAASADDGTAAVTNVTLNGREIYVTGVASNNGKEAAPTGPAGTLNLSVNGAGEGLPEHVGIVVDGTLHLDNNLQTTATASVYTVADLALNKSVNAPDVYLGSGGDVLVDGLITINGTDKITVEAGNDALVRGGNLISKTIDFTVDRDFAMDGGVVNASENLSIVTDGNIYLRNGSLTAFDAGMLALGYIDESYNNSAAATVADSFALQVRNELTALAGGSAADHYGIDLGSRYNKLHKVTMDSNTGNVILGNGNTSAQDLEVAVQLGETVNGDISIHNYAESPVATVANDIVIKKSLQATGDVTLINDEQDINVNQVNMVFVKGDNINMRAKRHIENGATILAIDAVVLEAEKDVNNYASIESREGIVNIEAGDNVYNIGDTASDAIKAKGKITIKAGSAEHRENAGEIWNTTKIHSDADIYIEATDVIVNAVGGEEGTPGESSDTTGDMSAGGQVEIKTHYLDPTDNEEFAGIYNWASISADKKAILNSADELVNTGNIIVSHGDVDLDAVKVIINGYEDVSGAAITADTGINVLTGGKISNYGDYTTTKGNIMVTSSEDTIENYGHYFVRGQGDINVRAQTDIENTGDFTIGAAGKIDVESVAGDILNVGQYVTADGDIWVTAEQGSIFNTNRFYSGEGDIRMRAGEDLLNAGVMEVLKGSIRLTSEDGTLFNNYGADLLTGAGDIILEATGSEGSLYYVAYDANTGEYTVEDVPTGAEILTYTAGPQKGTKYFVDASGEHSVIKDGSIYNGGDAMALGGVINFWCTNGDVVNYDDFNTLISLNDITEHDTYRGTDIATGSINMQVRKGTLYNTHDLEAGEDIYLVANDGLTNFAYNIYAGKNITLTAENGDLQNTAIIESVAGDVTLTAKRGNVINGASQTNRSGDIITLDGTVTLQALDQNGTGAGDVTNFGDIIAVGVADDAAAPSGSIVLKAEGGNVYNYDDFNAYSKTSSGNNYEHVLHVDDHISVADLDEDISYNLATGDITLQARRGTLYNSKQYLAALGDVTLEAAEGLGSYGQVIYAGKNITMTLTEGDLINRAELFSVDGDVSLNAENGTVVNMLSGNVIARNGNVLLNAGAATEDEHTIYYVDQVGNRSTLAAGSLVAEDRILRSDKYYYDDALNKVAITNTHSAPVGEQVYSTISYLDANNNPVVLADEIIGDVEAYRQGDVVNRGDILAQGDADNGKGAITLLAAHGNATNYDDFNLYDGENNYDYLGETGTAHFNPGTELYYDERGILISDSDLNIRAPEGYLYNNMDIVSDRDVILISGKDLTVGINVSNIQARDDILVQSLDGSVINDANIVSLEGNIVLNGYRGVSSTANADHLQALNGSISTVSTYGEVNVAELVAGEMATAGSAHGNVILGKVQGKDVVLFNQNENATNTAGELVVGNRLVLQGDNMNLPEIERLPGSELLQVDVAGVGGSTMQSDLELNINGDARFTTANLTNVEVNTTGRLAVDKVHIAGEAHFTDGTGYRTGIYGRAPYQDDSNAMYYDLGSGEGETLSTDLAGYLQPEAFDRTRAVETMAELQELLTSAGAAAETFNTDNQGWMNLYIDGQRTQRSNGMLLRFDTGYTAYNQRWSVEDLSTKLLDYKPGQTYMEHFKGMIDYFERYPLLDLSQSVFEDEWHKITVEERNA